MILGYLPGTFDLLHVGHLSRIMQSKALCDKLIVAVLNDDVVVNYKGKRPIIPFQRRADLIRAIQHVDVVIESSTRNVYEEWLRIKFNVVFVGDEWYGTPEWVKWEAQLSTHGVIIRYLPKEHYKMSTTEIYNTVKGKK